MSTTGSSCIWLLHWLSVRPAPPLSNRILITDCPFKKVIYLLWSYLPSPFLHQLGIYYYPNRWWSLAIPSFLVMTIVYIYVALASYNTGYLALPMNSIENVVDEAANIAVIDSKGRRRPGGSEKMKPRGVPYLTLGVTGRKLNWTRVWSEGTDGVMDIPLGGVCEVLYGQEREDDSDNYLSEHF
jgi:phosphatidylinositol N-acetylglucosaminyltransferase subunit P